jgi:hypothetical protein
VHVFACVRACVRDSVFILCMCVSARVRVRVPVRACVRALPRASGNFQRPSETSSGGRNFRRRSKTSVGVRKLSETSGNFRRLPETSASANGRTGRTQGTRSNQCSRCDCSIRFRRDAPTSAQDAAMSRRRPWHEPPAGLKRLRSRRRCGRVRAPMHLHRAVRQCCNTRRPHGASVPVACGLTEDPDRRRLDERGRIATDTSKPARLLAKDAPSSPRTNVPWKSDDVGAARTQGMPSALPSGNGVGELSSRPNFGSGRRQQVGRRGCAPARRRSGVVHAPCTPTDIETDR